MATLPAQGLTIGDLSQRTGLAVSAIRFYESHGILAPVRNAGGHRRYARSDIRRLSFVIAAQNMGFALAEIASHLADLPPHRAPNRRDWERISDDFRVKIDARIADLQRMRERLDGCIRCGCLSLDTCPLYNPDDRSAADGPGPRYLLGD
ncbi:redox-sensitive transcriptional activator SoxR [Paracoccus tegillarcae]|uniref:Redox-sensitive transcriptional activator SoxR n=1 Tax=Paracoccus tegillarcae TaxID=1529068 RepID=A0A2K9EBI6_9RHOB|nr:redox-sensitive transcriptional activator SoxR [Paracoccus tegillarcae]AUH32250.1 redox-sensitive transcriptional activator SoxR [Paracoccus tegillarcae]